MSRLIDVDALGVGRCSKDVLPEAYCAGWNGLIDLIEKAPTIDAVPVVRCRECKHLGFCGDATNLEVMGFYGYCSRGERKEGADNDT